MKMFLFFLGAILLLSSCCRKPIAEGEAAIVVYEPSSGDVRTLNEDVSPYVKLYSDFVVVRYTRSDNNQASRTLTHTFPVSRLGFLRWKDPAKE